MKPRTPAVPSPVSRKRGAGLVRVVAVSAGVLVLAAGALWGFGRDGEGSGEMREVASLDLARVETGSFAITTTAMGELEARNQIELRSELDTRAGIVEIVPEGMVVKKGDLLVQLNAEELQDQIDEQTLEVERAQADVTAAQAELTIQLSENESKRRAAQLKVDIARLALQEWREGEDVKQRQALQLEIEQAERDRNRLKERFERSTQLLAEGFLSKDECDQDEIDYVDADARYKTALLDQNTYLSYQFPRDEKTKLSDVEEAEADLARTLEQNEINATAKRSSLETAKRQLTLKTDRLAKMESQHALATIRAPADGLVVYSTSLNRDGGFFDSEGPLQVGREVRPNELLIILPDTSSMVASVRVLESLAGRIRPGQRAIVKVDALAKETFSGVVESIGVLAETGGWRDPNRREYSVRVALNHDNGAGLLKPSMRAEATVTLGTVQDSLIVPVQAVFSDGPVQYVLTPRGSRFQRVPVKVGRMSDSYAEILEGVGQNERVLLREPASGEVLNVAWTAPELEAVGLALGEDGRPYSPQAAAMAEAMRAMAGIAPEGVQVGGPTGEGERGPRREGGPRGGRGDGPRRPGDGTEVAKDGTGAAGGAADANAEAAPVDTTLAQDQTVEPAKTGEPAEQKAPAKD